MVGFENIKTDRELFDWVLKKYDGCVCLEPDTYKEILNKYDDLKNPKISIDYESEIKNLCDKHKEEMHHLENKIDELRKENKILKLKWSVVEMIFTK